MDIQDLLIFQTVAQESSISRAAQKLSYAQSNITMRIQKLEGELGTPLFYRHRRGVTLSSAGHLLLDYTQKILNLMDEASKAVKREGEGLKGTLKMGAIDSVLTTRLPPVLSAFHEVYPDVQICIETASSASLIRSVLNYELEGAFVAGEVDHPDLIEKVLFLEELVVIRKTSSTNRDTDFANQTLLIFNRGCTYRCRLEQWLDEEGFTPLSLIEFASAEGKLECVKAGLGSAVVTKSMAQKFMDGKQLVVEPIPEAYSLVPTVFIRRKNVFLSKAVEEFLKIATSLSAESGSDSCS